MSKLRAVIPISLIVALFIPFALSLGVPSPVGVARASGVAAGLPENDLQLVSSTTSGGLLGGNAQVKLQSNRENRVTTIQVDLHRGMWSRAWTVVGFSEDPPKH